jgi:hypothetical protein
MQRLTVSGCSAEIIEAKPKNFPQGRRIEPMGSPPLPRVVVEALMGCGAETDLAQPLPRLNDSPASALADVVAISSAHNRT